MVVKRGDWKNTPRDCYLLPGSEYRVFSTMIRSGVRTAKGRNRSESESTFFGSLLGPYDTTLELAKCQWVNRYRVQRTKVPTSADITSKPLAAGRILTPPKMNNRWGSERQQRRDWSFRLAIGASTGFLLIILWEFDSWPNGDSHIPSDISTPFLSPLILFTPVIFPPSISHHLPQRQNWPLVLLPWLDEHFLCPKYRKADWTNWTSPFLKATARMIQNLPYLSSSKN